MEKTNSGSQIGARTIIHDQFSEPMSFAKMTTRLMIGHMNSVTIRT